MTALLTVLALGLIGFVGVDVFRTVLLPSSTGLLSHLLSRVLWQISRRLPGPLRPSAMRASGPLSIVLSVVAWLLGLLTGFALLYLPSVDSLALGPDIRFSGAPFEEALYLSGTSLLTLGFGDVVGQTTLVRLLTIAEAASGLGVLTATLGYLPAMYTLVSELRTNNRAVADLGADDVQGAAELLAVDGSLVLDRVRRDVIAARQHLLRFPVLHYFHPVHDESVVALLRGASSLWIAAHFADDQDRPLHRQVLALERALRQLTENLLRHGGEPLADAAPADAEKRFARARAASVHPEAARIGIVTPDSLQLLQHLTAVVDAYASRHNYSPPAAAEAVREPED